MLSGSVLKDNLRSEVDEIKTGTLLDNWIYRNENGTIVAHQIFKINPNVGFLECKTTTISAPSHKNKNQTINRFKCSFNVN